MAKQIPFTYEMPLADELVRGEANQNVFQALSRAHWPSGRMAIIGEAGSGKTTILQELMRAGGRVIETPKALSSMNIQDEALVMIDDFSDFIAKEDAETAVFHLLNETAAHHVKLVLFSKTPLDQIEISLPDLRSRLATVECFEIGAPDDFMVMQLIARGFEARGVIVQADVIEYLAKRVERSYEAISRAVEALNVTALSEKGKINKARARAYFEDLHSQKLW